MANILDFKIGSGKKRKQVNASLDAEELEMLTVLAKLWAPDDEKEIGLATALTQCLRFAYSEYVERMQQQSPDTPVANEQPRVREESKPATRKRKAKKDAGTDGNACA